MERKSLLLEVKSVGDDGAGYLQGYGAVKGNIDSYKDVIVDGAFDNLQTLIDEGFMGEAHAWDKAVGMVMEAKEDEHGLWVKMDYHSTQDAQDLRTKVAERIAKGKKVGLSIGYYAKDAEEGEYKGERVRFLKKIEVFEVSVVLMPANDQATVLNAKSHSERRADQLENLTAQAESYIQRLQEIKSTGASDERVQKFTDELSAVAALCLDAIGDLSAKTEAEPEFDSFPDGWEATLARAQELINK
jgi:HK97 family phage prohead protease